MAKYSIGTLNNISKVGLDRLTDQYALTEDINEANGIVVRSYKMHEMDFSDNLLAIGRAGAGVNNIPLDRCADEGIVVFNTPGANSNAVKELVIAGLIMGSRNMYEGISWANTLEGDVSGQVEKGKKQFAGTEIEGKTLGIIGLGAIGAKVANAAHALGMNIVGNSVVVHPFLTAPCKMYDDVAEMVKVCDYVSIHVPSLPATKGMINKDLIANMKDGAIVLNYARPDLVVEEDIIAALESGKLRKYMTDLADENLINKPGIVSTPHLGASTKEAEDNCASMAVDELMDYIENGNIRNSVNFPPVSLDAEAGTTRVGILYKGEVDVTALLNEAVGADKVVKVEIGKSRTEYGYALALVKEDACKDCLAGIKADGVIKVRVL
ncbi:3-phosphoglycerate dehydrogenase [Mogibacterium kristiansenii]|uniref:3-phosphoglycerate dehydrogenase n=1 Tax=Mogibacterium kristiansenii TaxID=2606708 RepID=A0A6N7X5C6_9FIRM|nr:3-phosphoglycerate dehydrogenase [Mogibacterium kristiansenii]MEE0369647.1 3-phosphoglycerate dehydrogenase [Clostridia bacterium]MDD6699612.1 3-phosphoglycerate dehydrogenase [Mogibacterium kristiansenii]MEE0417580.1 3-phosphoglycerate dehydrogenase [Clostridia bacterium]MEE0553601.1 3-phosphoglycerate dehydrogenase [Clostridia bacterium]MEE1375122.1 3-phosphoglycerate dehydrogenase [Clostridia bacterium]